MNCSFADKDPDHPCGRTSQNPNDTNVVPLSTCKRDISNYLYSLGLISAASKAVDHPSVVSESDLILNRCGMVNVDEETANSLTVCPIHRRSLTLDWPGSKRTYCEYPLHKMRKRKTSKNTRRINKVFSEEIFTIHGSVVPIGSAICGSCRIEHYKLRHIQPDEESTSEEKSNSEAQSADEAETEVAHASTSSFTPMRSSSQLGQPRKITDTPNVDRAHDSEFSSTDAQSSSSVPDHEISLWEDEKTNQNEKRDVLNSAMKEISDGRCSPLLSTLNTEWNDVGQRSQYYYVKKTKDIISNVLHTIAPGQEKNLWQAVKRSADPLEDPEEPEVKQKKWDSESVKSLVAAYNATETSQTRTQILSIFAYDFRKSELQELIPGLSKYTIDTARKHATEIGAGKPVPEQEIKRCRLDPVKIDHFLDFISTPTYLQDTAYGTRMVKLDDGSKLTIPNAIRTVIPSRIISQYISYCESINFEPASESTLWRVLQVCPASQQKSLQGLDYFSTEGGNAFDTLKDIVTTLSNKGLDDRKSKEFHQQLKDGKFYLKTDFKAHIADQDECPDHCCSYALSDVANSEFSSKCNHHEHTLQCNRCYKLDCVLEQMKNTINSANVTEEERQRLNYEFEAAQTDVLAWKAHVLRTHNQEAAKYDILRTLDDGSVMLVMDWAMKFLPTRFREKMTDFYGKRGRNWHVSSVISKRGQELEVECYVHIFDSCTQNWFAVAAIVEDVLCNIKKQDPNVENVYIKSDNAGCYHSTQLLSSLPEIGNRTGITVKQYDFSDPQSGKDICDRKIASMKSHIRRYVNEKHDVITADDMKTALDSHTGVKGCRVAVAEVCIENESAKTAKSIEGISLLNNFAFNEDSTSMRTWRSYNIGVGKVVEIEKEFHGHTNLKILRQSNERTHMTKGTVKGVGSVSTGSTCSLFYCEEQGCIQTFPTYDDMHQHMDVGEHTTETEKDTTFDRVRKTWVKKVEHLQTDREAHTEASTSEITSEQVEERVEKGWALKKSKKPQRMTTSVKQFLTDKFNEGARSGHKADSNQVAQEMKYLRNAEGGLMFSSNEWRAARQISSFFSRLSALQRMKTTDSEGTYDEDDLEMWNKETDHVERRQNVFDQLDVLHPIMYKNFDLCELGRQHKLKTKFKIKDLQEICQEYDMTTDGPASRKDTYISPLLEFLQGCSCATD